MSSIHITAHPNPAPRATPGLAATLSRTAKSYRLAIVLAAAEDREAIYRFRHDVYARELRQHRTNDIGCLRDSLDERNVYLVAKAHGEIVGFVSITPPGGQSYSIDKYFPRDRLPFAFDAALYEVRLLTVLRPQRGGEAAALLMYAALRYIEAHGGTRVVVIGRRELRDIRRTPSP